MIAPTVSRPSVPTLRDWQARELDNDAPRRNIFASPRTGKTLYAALWLDGLRSRHNVTRMLVSAPLRVCPLWMETLASVGLPVIDAFNPTTLKSREALTRGWDGVVVVNVDKLHSLRDVFAKWVQGFVCDEVHETASPSSARGRAARAIGRRAAYFRGLTGTLVPNHHGDLWSPLVLAGGYEGPWGKFMDRYTVRDPYFKSHVTKHIREDELFGMVRACSAIVRREDVFGPDTYDIVERKVPLTPAAMGLYRKLAREWVLDEGGVLVDATHTLSRLIRLQQLTSGFLPDEDGGIAVVHTEKIDAVLADLREIIHSGEKAVVFHRFVREGIMVTDELRRRGVPTFIINGSLKADESEAQRAKFTAYPEGAVIVVQIQSGSVGISLAEATHALYLSRTFSFIQDEQSRDRVYKPGHSRTITYYNAPGTIDTLIAKALHAKRDIHQVLRMVDLRAAVLGDVGTVEQEEQEEDREPRPQAAVGGQG